MPRSPGFTGVARAPCRSPGVRLIALPSESTRAESWSGPFESEYGYHLVMLTKSVEGRLPELTEVIDRVRADAEREAMDAMQEEAIQAIVDTYEVRRTF